MILSETLWKHLLDIDEECNEMMDGLVGSRQRRKTCDYGRTDKKRRAQSPEKCIGCGHCVELCHRKAPVLHDEGIVPGYG